MKTFNLYFRKYVSICAVFFTFGKLYIIPTSPPPQDLCRGAVSANLRPSPRSKFQVSSLRTSIDNLMFHFSIDFDISWWKAWLVLSRPTCEKYKILSDFFWIDSVVLNLPIRWKIKLKSTLDYFYISKCNPKIYTCINTSHTYYLFYIFIYKQINKYLNKQTNYLETNTENYELIYVPCIRMWIFERDIYKYSNVRFHKVFCIKIAERVNAKKL